MSIADTSRSTVQSRQVPRILHLALKTAELAAPCNGNALLY